MRENTDIKQHGVEMDRDEWIQGIKDCIPTLLGYISIGFAAGVIGKTSGLSIVEVTLMSLLIYAGSAQFIVASMVAGDGSAAAIIVTVFIVNLRHLLLSAALSPYFRHLPPLKAMFIGSLLTDETFGVAVNRSLNQKWISEKWMHGLNISAYLCWVAATLAGAFFGDWITNPGKFGLDFAMPAMFIGLLVLQMSSRGKIVKDLVVAISGVVIVLGASLMFTEGMAVIIATGVAATIGMMIEKWK